MAEIVTASSGAAKKVEAAQAERERVAQDRAAAALQAGAASRPGSIEVLVPDAAKLDDFRWTVKLQSGKEELTEELVGAKNWTHIGVTPGQYKVTVAASIGKTPSRASAALSIEPGEAFKLTLPLTEPSKEAKDASSLVPRKPPPSTPAPPPSANAGGL